MFKKIELHDLDEFRLESLEIAITSQCNFTCEYCCAYGKTEKALLTAVEVIAIIQELEDLNRIKLSGGEVLLYFDECNKIIDYCTQNNIYTQINTNGTLLDERKIQQLKDSGIGTLHISLNFKTALEFSKYYNKDKEIFYQLEKNIKTCIAKGLHVVVETIIFNETKNQIAELLTYIYGLGVREVEIQAGVTIEKSGWDDVINDNEYQEIISIVMESKQKDLNIYFSCLPKMLLNRIDQSGVDYQKELVYFPQCIDGKRQLHLHNNGDVLICELGYPKVLGNIYKGLELKEVFNTCYEEINDFSILHPCAKHHT